MLYSDAVCAFVGFPFGPYQNGRCMADSEPHGGTRRPLSFRMFKIWANCNKPHVKESFILAPFWRSSRGGLHARHAHEVFDVITLYSIVMTREDKKNGPPLFHCHISFMFLLSSCQLNQAVRVSVESTKSSSHLLVNRKPMGMATSPAIRTSNTKSFIN